MNKDMKGKYNIVVGTNTGEVIDEVNQLLADGYIPHGTLVFHDVYIFQVMTKHVYPEFNVNTRAE